MIQKQLYKRDISKDIDGVVKATDLSEETLFNEVQEYVLTNELMQPSMLPRLFEEMSNPNYGKSVWLSGHFGSGKSHLLKMLSVVLAGHKFNNKTASELFAIKAENDFEFANNVNRSCVIPTETILFNIQSKSDGLTSTYNDPVLAVFAKVYNEHLGYSDQYNIANFERFLDKKGLYAKFKELYMSKFGASWETDGRDSFYLIQDEIGELYAEIAGVSVESAKSGVANFIEHSTMDINTFAQIVKEYIESKPKDFRLIFCVDEVGQFIANDINKMLSLQSIAEDLSSKTLGKSFMIVTSQNDLSATVGDFKKAQKNDFSKITGRFAFKIALTSANADEVIQKRLLAKTPEGATLIGKVYDKEENNLRTILQFEGNTPFNIKYKDREHFINTYPFTAYQFELLQASIKELNNYNAFTGGHQSLGERSMLSICQKVVQKYASNAVGDIISFSAMFDGISDMLQSNVISNINMAAKSLDPFTLDVLKTLFLTKYEKRISTTLDNITILMLPAFEADLSALKKRIQESLNILEQQVYIQRSASGVYEFLTNQEKDIEQEIRNTNIDSGVVRKHLSDILFGDIYNQAKIPFDGSKNNIFAYAKRCDGALIGKDEEIALHFITPLCDDLIIRNNPTTFSMGNQSDLVVFMPEDGKLVDDILFYEQTQKYTGVASDGTDPLKEIIIADKRVKNAERRRVIASQVVELLSRSELYMMGSISNISKGSNIKDRISSGMVQLISSVYTNLRILQSEYTEKSISDALKSSDGILLETDMSEAENELLNKLLRNKSVHERTTVKQLLVHFKSRPYGWYDNAVLALVAQLYKRSKISFKRDGVQLTDDDISKSLMNSRTYDTTIIEVDEAIQPAQVQKFKKFYQEYFGEPCTAIEAKDISKDFIKKLTSYKQEINSYYARKRELKFLEALENPLNYISELAAKTHPYFITNLSTFEDRLLDDKDDVLDRIEQFMNGPQLSIYEQVGKYINSNSANLSYLTEGHLEALQAIYDSMTPYQNGLMQKANEHLTNLKAELSALQTLERNSTIESLRKSHSRLQELAESISAPMEKVASILTPLNKQIQQTILNEPYIGNIKAIHSSIETTHFDKALQAINALIPAPVKPSNSEVEGGDTTPPQVPHITIINSKSMKINFDKTTLETREDVESYIESLKKRYLELIDEDKRILL